MANLRPFVRLRDLSSSTFAVLATTTNVVDWSFSYELDRPGQVSIEVAASDPGDAATSGDSSFASALLQAAAPLGGGTPKPILIEFSLDGGTSYDARRLARNPHRTIAAGHRAIREDGADLASDALTLSVQERVTYTDVALSDAISAPAGTIIPLDTIGIAQPGDTIPYLCGILQVSPDFPSAWSTSAKNRLRFTGYVNPTVAGTATNVDADSITTLSLLETMCNRLAGAVDYATGVTDQQYSHFLVDCSDTPNNIVSNLSFTPVPTTPPSTAPNTVVVGHVGSSALLTFNASPTGPSAETDNVAVVHTDASTIQSDDATVYQAANFVGGRSNLGGLPEGSTIHGIALANYQAIPSDLLPGPEPGYMTPDGTAWTDGLLCVGVSFQDDSGGGIFFLDPSQSTVRPIPGSPKAPVHALGYDNGAGVRTPGLVMGGSYGCWLTNDLAFLPNTTRWTKLGTMNEDVQRVDVQHNPSQPAYPTIFARSTRSTGNDMGSTLWRWNYNATTTAWEWQTVLIGAIVDHVATDYQTVWVVMNAPANELHEYHVAADGTATQVHSFALPSGTVIRRLHHVVTTSPDADSVWMLCDGGTSTSPAYYVENVSGTWTLYNANTDSTIKGPAPDYAPVGVYTAVGVNVTFDPQLPLGGTGVKVMLGTSQGCLWTDQPLGGAFNWRRVDQAGLANYSVTGIAVPEAVHKLGTDDAHMLNPAYFLTSDNEILISNSSARWVTPLKGKDRTLAGVHLSNITLAVTGDLPSNLIQTWGTKNADGTAMTSSPIGLASSTHVHIPTTSADALPPGLYIRRSLDLHSDWVYKMVSQSCHVPGINIAHLPEIQSRANVLADEASAGVITVAKRFIQQHAQSQTVLTLESDFSTTTHKLRVLRPTHRVAIQGTLQIRDISSTGAVVTSTPYTFSGSEAYYVLRHTIKRGQAGNTAVTETVLGSRLLNNFVTAEDIGNSLYDALHSAKVWG